MLPLSLRLTGLCISVKLRCVLLLRRHFEYVLKPLNPIAFFRNTIEKTQFLRTSISKSVLRLDKEIKLRPIDCEADALTNTPSRWRVLKVVVNMFINSFIFRIIIQQQLKREFYGCGFSRSFFRTVMNRSYVTCYVFQWFFGFSSSRVFQKLV